MSASIKFKCPNCNSGSTKSVAMLLQTGTRYRNTTGVSSRSVWGSSSTYQSALVQKFGGRPGYLLSVVFVLFGLLFIAAWSGETGGGVGVVIGVALVVIGAVLAKGVKPGQERWDARMANWICSRCGLEWKP